MTKQISLITGSTSGIGKQIALDLLAKGHYVIFMSRRYESTKELMCTIKDKGFDFTDYSMMHGYDMADKDDVNTWINMVKSSYMCIDNIIFNVGETCRKDFDKVTVDDFNHVMNTNVILPYHIVTELSSMIKRRIIFIGSVLGHETCGSSIPYGVSKGSLEILTKHLAKEFASKGVTVNTLAPGFTSTSWHQGKSEEQIERIKQRILLGRFATTKEISHACQFIIENDYINGQTLCVDGGYHLD